MTKLCLLLGAIHVTHGLNNFNANAVRRKVSRKNFLNFQSLAHFGEYEGVSFLVQKSV